VNPYRSVNARLVGWCATRALTVIVIAMALGIVAAGYAVRHFAMTTDTAELLSPQLEWRIREAAFNRIFPPSGNRIVVVVDGQTPEIAESAAAALADQLSAEPRLFNAVRRPDAGSFWSHNALLYAPTSDVRANMNQLIKAEPFLGPLAADPSLRGLMGALGNALQGVASGQASLEQLDPPIHRLAVALEDLRAGRPTFFSWQSLVAGSAIDPRELRHLILIDPNLDYARLEPGRAPSEAIRDLARTLHLDPAHGVRVRLTGPVPLQDEEFATLAERATLIGSLALIAIVVMLWLAVRSVRLIAAILVTTVLGLVMASALGLLIFHRFNVISVAFIPMFVGLGIDFGIQFSVRYRAERSTGVSVHEALIATGRGLGRSLTLAATAIASGFLAFAPTAYVGVSQLGTVAGLGLFIALGLNLTLLPALIQVSRAPGAPEGGAHPALARIDNFVIVHRRLVIGLGVGAALVSAAALPLLHFDFNPIHLRSPRVESVATLLDLMRDPVQSPNTLEAVRPDLAAADQLAASVRQLPEVSDARTLSSFVPTDQPEKLAIIADAQNLLDFVINPVAVAPAPDDGELIKSLTSTARKLREVATDSSVASQDARQLGSRLDELAQAEPAARQQAVQLLMPGLALVLSQVRDSLQPEPISLATLPPDLRRGWLAPDGQARISVVPKGDSNNDQVLSHFIDAVSPLMPDASGTPMSIRQSGRAVVGAFTEAGVLSFIAITLLLLLVLRRLRDVAITMAPIILTGFLTLGSCVALGQPLNFANIIALPLLFGIGVAFHIYFVMSWRSGGSHLLSSSLARAVFFSALTTATGFGSLWASSHPGTASMGELLMISLIWTLVSALLFQPALMGVPRSQD
jgi:hopanoid biosynthesis associated RND transporter like protein HpnN